MGSLLHATIPSVPAVSSISLPASSGLLSVLLCMLCISGSLCCEPDMRPNAWPTGLSDEASLPVLQLTHTGTGCVQSQLAPGAFRALLSVTENPAKSKSPSLRLRQHTMADHRGITLKTSYSTQWHQLVMAKGTACKAPLGPERQ